MTPISKSLELLGTCPPFILLICQLRPGYAAVTNTPLPILAIYYNHAFFSCPCYMFFSSWRGLCTMLFSLRGPGRQNLHHVKYSWSHDKQHTGLKGFLSELIHVTYGLLTMSSYMAMPNVKETGKARIPFFQKRRLRILVKNTNYHQTLLP